LCLVVATYTVLSSTAASTAVDKRGVVVAGDVAADAVVFVEIDAAGVAVDVDASGSKTNTKTKTKTNGDADANVSSSSSLSSPPRQTLAVRVAVREPAQLSVRALHGGGISGVGGVGGFCGIGGVGGVGTGGRGGMLTGLSLCAGANRTVAVVLRDDLGRAFSSLAGG
jgi:hypothetical protein